MFNKIIKEIKKHNKIILIRHKAPDYDAYGSQIGLYYSLVETFPNKKIYCTGDENINNLSSKAMDELKKEDYISSLVICLDTSSIPLLNDDNYKNADKVIVLDHHKNTPELGDIILIKDNYSSCSELVCELIKTANFKINKKAADILFIGMVGDSNRFLYKGTSSNTFDMASFLVKSGCDIVECYKIMQKEESIEEKLFKGFVLSNFKVDGRVAYIYISKKDRLKYSTSENFASRGCINLLSGIINVDAYVGFTESDDENIVYTEIRSKCISVVSVAKKHGGGGHDLACGLRLEKKDDYTEIIKELNEVVKNECL